MSVFITTLLFVSAAFNIFTWPRFFQRVSKDARSRDAHGNVTAFYRVHLILVLIALLIAAACVVGGIITLMR